MKTIDELLAELPEERREIIRRRTLEMIEWERDRLIEDMEHHECITNNREAREAARHRRLTW